MSAILSAAPNLFGDFISGEIRDFTVNFALFLLGTEEMSTATWTVPTGLSALASSTGQYWGSFLSASATASGGPAASASATASALQSGSAYMTVKLSAQENLQTGHTYKVFAQLETDNTHIYRQYFDLKTLGGY